MRLPVAPPAGLPAAPTVVEPVGAPPAPDVAPEGLAVPAELVPGALDAFAALPALLGSLPLLRLPTLAGPGAPSAVLAPADPAPCAPAGDEAAPAAAPPDDAPPADPPPAPPPPAPCPRADIGDSRAATRSNLHNERDIRTTPFDVNAAVTGAFQKIGGTLRQSRALGAQYHFQLEQARPMPVRTEAKRLIAMSQVEEAIARLTHAHSRLAPITERLLDIEARLAVAKATNIERPARTSLREFTSKLVGEPHCRSPIERYETAVRQSAVK
jgi:hypothetical protein